MPAAVAAAAAAAASGGAILLYLLLTCRPQPAPDAEREEEQAPLLSGSGAAQGRDAGSEREEEPWPDKAPVGCCEATTVAARTARRTWELTVGRWGLHGIAFGIKRHMKRQLLALSALRTATALGSWHLHCRNQTDVLCTRGLIVLGLTYNVVDLYLRMEVQVGIWEEIEVAGIDDACLKRDGDLQHEYSGNDCRQLKGPEACSEVSSLLEYLKLCMFFSKKTFSAFLKFGGYNQEDILIYKARPRLMQPSFALVCDKRTKSFMLFIRGAISTKERLTAATAAEVPFHHIILSDRQISNVVLGYAHCGMLVAARWIAALVIPHLQSKVQEFPDFQIKVIGHSMGAGIGAILTYILHERHEFSSCTCLAFAPPACMTWELAESGKDFITSLVNRNDVVPAFSKVSSESLRSEVLVSSKLDDAQDQSLFATISQRVAFIKSHVLSISHSTGKIADHGSSITEPLLKDAADVIQPAANGHNTDCSQNSDESVILVSKEDVIIVKSAASGLPLQEGSDNNDGLETQQQSLPANGEVAPKQNGTSKDKQKEPLSASGSRQFFPPGRIIHMVAQAPPDSDPGEGTSSNEIIGIYETPRDLYGKIRLAPNMIKEHYMPSYISTMESLLEQLQKDDNGVCTTSNEL
ncbi:hypothetical protein EJB05_03349 [Eragrostis curvula]|uniref:Fungal lipase-type domain-containing protein n=1 Tax=Eragrostis curvula TaxID=38414 RepID=A0A5J9W719_9POAL|nr:hypothetical protein EJB05_03349 [Eragrostis curvula]